MSNTKSVTAQPKPYETPMRANPFFTYLNHNVHCLVYDLLDLPPISHASLGFVLSYKEAYIETSTAAAWNLNRYLEDKQSSAKQDRHRLMDPPFPLNAGFVRLQVLNLRTSRRAVNHNDCGLRPILERRFAKITIACMKDRELKTLDGFEVSKENSDFGFDLTDGVRDVPEAFMCRVLDQMYDDMAGGGSYKDRIRHIEMT